MLVVIFWRELLCLTVFLRIAGKSAKIRTRKNFASLSKLCLFCRQLAAIFAENNKKKIVPLVED